MTATPRLLIGRYELHEHIASGGMASVHIGRLAGPAGFSRPVAIKRLHGHLAQEPEFVAMFLDEARLAARIQHPNVVSTLDVVVTKGEIFLVMEFVQGEALSKLGRTVRASGTPIDQRIVAAIMSNVLHGLHAAHEAKDEFGRNLGIVHRDVSPQNVIVGVDGTARVLDFGVAKAVGRIHTTREGKIKGKLAYMALEQLEGAESVTRQVDVYAAGVVLWELLAGRRLYEGDSEAVVLARALRGNPPAVTSINTQLPREIDSVLARAIAQDPAMRYATARDFALDLERVLGVAPASSVGDWLRLVAGTSIDAQAALLLDMESHSSVPRNLSDDPLVQSVLAGTRFPSTHPEHDHAAAQPPPGTLSTVAAVEPRVGPSKSRTPSRRILTYVSLTALTFVVALFLSVRWASRSSGEAFATPPTAATSAFAPTPLQSSSKSAQDVGPAPVASEQRLPLPTSASARVPSAKARKPAPPPRPQNCDPPYSLDPEGHKIWKKQCLR